MRKAYKRLVDYMGGDAHGEKEDHRGRETSSPISLSRSQGLKGCPRVQKRKSAYRNFDKELILSKPRAFNVCQEEKFQL